MTAERIIFLAILAYVALIMILIGLVQMHKKEPVGFYTGETPPSKSELTDVAAWNRSHGIMFLCYGAVIFLCGLAGCLIDRTTLSAVLLIGGTVVPLPIMIIGHHFLIRRYRK